MLKSVKNTILDIIRQADLLLLTLCTVTSLFGVVMIYSATRYQGGLKCVIIQLCGLALGIVLYFVVSMVDLTEISKKWQWLLAFNLGFFLLLKTPLGVSANGNLAWLGVRGIPIQVQPAEVVKLTFILLLARQLAPRFGGVMQKADEHYTMQDEDLTIPRPIEFCTGSFAAIRTDVFKTIGGFDPEYFMYVEDADLTQRALRQGLVYLLPQFTATHAWHRDPMRDAGKFKMQLKSMGRYFKKWGIGKGNV